MYEELLYQEYHAAHNLSHIPTDQFLIHSHPFYEFYYFLSGDVHILYDGVEYEMQPHTLVIFVPNAFHGIHARSAEAFERYIVHFTENMISAERRKILMGGLPTLESLRSGAGRPPHIIRQADRLGFLDLMKEYYQLSGLAEPAQNAMAGVITETLVMRYLMRAAGPEQISGYPDYHSGQDELSRILNYIHQNLHGQFSLDLLCARFHISKSRLNALFRSRMGTTPMEYVTRRRVRYAQQLLLNGIPATQVGELAGFSDYTMFYRAYRKILNRAPSADSRDSKTGNSQLLSMRLEDGAVSDPGSGKMANRNGTIWERNEATQVTSVDIATIRDP